MEHELDFAARIVLKKQQEVMSNSSGKDLFSTLSDVELIIWQAAHPKGGREQIMAAHEREKRLKEIDSKANRKNAYIAIVGIFCGSFFTWLSC